MIRDERGAAAVEFMAILPYLLIGAILVWQLVMAGAVANAAENAARNGSRVAARGGGGTAAAMDSLPEWLADGARVDGSGLGTEVTVCIDVPVLVPGISIDGLEICRDAVFAREGGVLR